MAHLECGKCHCKIERNWKFCAFCGRDFSNEIPVSECIGRICFAIEEEIAKVTATCCDTIDMEKLIENIRMRIKEITNMGIKNLKRF